jgi:anti-anti-sigma factor
VLKEAVDTEVVAAVREVARGGRDVNPELGARLMAAEADAERRADEDPLSDREREVLRLLALGHTKGHGSIVVDLTEATFIDSTMLRVLLSVSKRLRPGGGELLVVCHEHNIRKIFEITLLDRVFTIFESRDAALAFLEAGGPSPPV